jgi:hypothetical protein
MALIPETVDFYRTIVFCFTSAALGGVASAIAMHFRNKDNYLVRLPMESMTNGRWYTIKIGAMKVTKFKHAFDARETLVIYGINLDEGLHLRKAEDTLDEL